MSHSQIARFPNQPSKRPARNNQAADQARKRIAELPDLYQQHAAPNKEQLVGVVQPTSVAAEEEVTTPVGLLRRRRPATQPPIPEADIAIPAELPPEHFDEPANDGPGWRAAFGKVRPFAIGIASFALIFLVYKAPIFLSHIGYLASDRPAASSTPPPAAPQVGPEPIISIPKINVTAPIIFARSNVEEAIQKDLEAGVVHYANTANPGEPGNSVIFGHSSNDWWEPGNFKFVFVLLERLTVGDTFTVNYNSTQYVYEVTETKVVEPTDLSVLNTDGSHQMTLITCTPPGTSWKRFVVKAKQISPTPAAATTPSNSNSTDFDGEQLTGTSTSLTQQFAEWWRKVTGGSQ